MTGGGLGGVLPMNDMDNMNSSAGIGDLPQDNGGSSPLPDMSASTGSGTPGMSTGSSMSATYASGARGEMDPKFKATDFKKNDLFEFATKHQLGPARKGMTRERKSRKSVFKDGN